MMEMINLMYHVLSCVSCPMSVEKKLQKRYLDIVFVEWMLDDVNSLNRLIERRAR
jgi:hypothetical protein